MSGHNSRQRSATVGAPNARRQAALAAALLAVDPDEATACFDDALASALSQCRIDAHTANVLRWWHRAALAPPAEQAQAAGCARTDAGGVRLLAALVAMPGQPAPPAAGLARGLAPAPKNDAACRAVRAAFAATSANVLAPRRPSATT